MIFAIKRFVSILCYWLHISQYFCFKTCARAVTQPNSSHRSSSLGSVLFCTYWFLFI